MEFFIQNDLFRQMKHIPFLRYDINEFFRQYKQIAFTTTLNPQLMYFQYASLIHFVFIIIFQIFDFLENFNHFDVLQIFGPEGYTDYKRPQGLFQRLNILHNKLKLLSQFQFAMHNKSFGSESYNSHKHDQCRSIAQHRTEPKAKMKIPSHFKSLHKLSTYQSHNEYTFNKTKQLNQTTDQKWKLSLDISIANHRRTQSAANLRTFVEERDFHKQLYKKEFDYGRLLKAKRFEKNLMNIQVNQLKSPNLKVQENQENLDPNIGKNVQTKICQYGNMNRTKLFSKIVSSRKNGKIETKVYTTNQYNIKLRV